MHVDGIYVDMCYKYCYMYKVHVAAVKGPQRVKYILYPSLVDDSNAFVIALLAVLL